MESKKHLLKCWLWKGLWALSFVALVLAWVGVMRRAPVFNMDPLFLLWNALILGILATPIKLDCNSCGVCGVKGSMM